MAAIATSLKQYLEDHKIRYEAIHHRRDYTAQETAADTGTPGMEFAKTVILRAGRRFAMVVLPAHHMVDMARMKQLLGAEDLRLATEDEIRRLCPDCPAGAEHPFGNLYEIPVYVSKDLTRNPWITFNAGTHEDAVRMRFADYDLLVEPKPADLSLRP